MENSCGSQDRTHSTPSFLFLRHLNWKKLGHHRTIFASQTTRHHISIHFRIQCWTSWIFLGVCRSVMTKCLSQSHGPGRITLAPFQIADPFPWQCRAMAAMAETCWNKQFWLMWWGDVRCALYVTSLSLAPDKALLLTVIVACGASPLTFRTPQRRTTLPAGSYVLGLRNCQPMFFWCFLYLCNAIICAVTLLNLHVGSHEAPKAFAMDHQRLHDYTATVSSMNARVSLNAALHCFAYPIIPVTYVINIWYERWLF